MNHTGYNNYGIGPGIPSARYVQRLSLRAAIADLLLRDQINVHVGRVLYEMVNDPDIEPVRKLVEALGGTLWNAYGEWDV